MYESLAGDERIELPPKVLETPIIPFDQSPVFSESSLCLQMTEVTMYLYHMQRLKSTI